MNCSISGEVPEEPVVSLKSGHVFEKRLILKHLELSGTCPVTGQDLAKEDLLAVQANKVTRPRPPAASSIPGVLKIMQNEWDALMLETHTLKKHLNATREELSHALYQHDAACRVIARLVKERDEARAALVNVQANMSAAVKQAGGQANGGAGADDMDVEDGSGTPLPSEVVEKMLATAKALTKPRKKNVKALQAACAKPETVAAYTKQASHTLHTAKTPGVLCLDAHPSDDSLLLSGGADGHVLLVNRTTGKTEASLKHHKKAVTAVKFHQSGEAVYTTSADNTTVIWSKDKNGFKASKTLSDSSDGVVGCSVHPSGEYLVTADAAGSWHFYGAQSGELYTSVSDEKSKGFTCIEFHPDGLILGLGTNNNAVSIYDVKTQKNVCSFSNGHEAPITAISFSENGYYFASGDQNGLVKLWDLRKLEDFHTIQPENKGPIRALKFDRSGSLLAIGGAEVRVFKTKPWELVQTFSSHSAEVTDIVFGANAAFLASSSKDRTVQVYAA